MPTSDPSTSPGIDEARRFVASSSFPERPPGPLVGGVGLEPEFIVLRVDRDGRAEARIPLAGERGVVAALERRSASSNLLRELHEGPPPVLSLARGGRITFEPGAQIEHSTAVHGTAAAALEDVDRTAGELARALASVDGVLVSVGLDLWTDRQLVRQQLESARYRSMAAYLDARSAHGRVMMRHTAGLQVNLDLGPPRIAAERWRLSNLLSPISTASFACSPEDGWCSRRARAWQELDPTRTGFPAALLRGDDVDPGEAYADFALDADVLLFWRQGTDSGHPEAVPGEPGFRFRDWIERGHPLHGHPTTLDLERHLTTLFPETRPRGFLEIRSCDALPARWRGACIVFWTGLIYDDEARSGALSLLASTLDELPDRWRAAARLGLSSPPLREEAEAIWEQAIAGARRLPEGYNRESDLIAAEDFLDRFIAAGRTPADELRELLDHDSLAALLWARERAV